MVAAVPQYISQLTFVTLSLKATLPRALPQVNTAVAPFMLLLPSSPIRLLSIIRQPIMAVLCRWARPGSPRVLIFLPCVRLVGNHAGGVGGGMFVLGETTLDGAEFIGNSAASGGGGSTGNFYITNSRFEDNHATNGNGGGLEGVGSIVATEFLSNTASGNGGGLSALDRVEITDFTLRTIMRGWTEGQSPVAMAL